MRAVLLAGLLGLTGCYRMTITNGASPAAATAAPGVDDQWRSASVLDVVAIDQPARLEVVCKETGWAKIEQEQTFVNGLVDLFLAGGIVYESTHASVYCAATPPPAKPAPAPSAPGSAAPPAEPPKPAAPPPAGPAPGDTHL